MIRLAVRHAARLRDAFQRSEYIYMVVVAVLIGLMGGLGAVLFRRFIQLVQLAAWQRGTYTVDFLYGLPWWWKIAAPAAVYAASPGGRVVTPNPWCPLTGHAPARRTP